MYVGKNGTFLSFCVEMILGKTFPIKSKKIFRKLFTIRVKGYPLPFTGWFIKNVNVCKKRWKLILISLQDCVWKTEKYEKLVYITGKSFSEELILASTNPQYNIRLLVEFIELQAQYMKTTSLELVVYMNYSECKYKNKKQFLYTTDQFCEQCAKNQYYIFKDCISTE